uniref:Uncharacterized protein n=1 Tax=Lotus japonicus TaxID=34305 RepID=I3SFR9_LOTJA|nr:unknown [Lotus japonicus]
MAATTCNFFLDSVLISTCPDPLTATKKQSRTYSLIGKNQQ